MLMDGGEPNGATENSPRERNVLHIAHRLFALLMMVACILLVLIFMTVGIVSIFLPPVPPSNLRAYRSELPAARVAEYESCQEGTVQAFEQKLGASIFQGPGSQAHGDLPLTLDATKLTKPGGSRRLGEQHFWDGMQFMVENRHCMDTRKLLCQLLLDGMCDCANSSVELLVGETPNKIMVHCDPGDMIRWVHSGTFDFSGITKESIAAQKALTNREEKLLESGVTKVVMKGSKLEVTGLEAHVSAKIQVIPTIDLMIGHDFITAHATGSVMTTINFTVETQRPLMVQGSDIIHMPNPPVVKQRCVAFVCFGMMFQAAVRLSFFAEGHSRVKGSVSADFNFLAHAQAYLDGTAEPMYEANISDINYWSDIPYAPFLGHKMQFNLSIIPMITVFTVPGIPMSFMNNVKWQVTESHAQGGTLRRSGMNMHTKQYFDSFGLPSTLLVTWPQIEQGLNMTLRASSVRVQKAFRALAAACNVTFSDVSLSSIVTVAESSTETIRLVVPDSLEKAFPKKVRTYGPIFCWTVGKACTAAMDDPECTADESLYCPQQRGLPNALPIKTIHFQPIGAVAFQINLGCKYDALQHIDGGKLYRSVQEHIKQTIAFEAVAQDVSPNDVHLVPVEGELGLLQVTVVSRDGLASSYILKKFGRRKRIEQALAKSIGYIKGINDVCDLSRNSVVSKVSKPMVKSCPQSFCPSGNIKMRSHGKNSFCQAKYSTRFIPRVKPKRYFTLESCQEACFKNDKCYGIEYEYMRGVENCVLWMQPIHFCSVMATSGDTNDMKSFFECYSKCDWRNTQVVLPASFPQARALEFVVTEPF